MKKLIKEQKDRELYLQNAWNSGCIVKHFKPKQDGNQWVKTNENGYLAVYHDRDNNQKPIWAAFMINKDDEAVFYYEDGIKRLVDKNNQITNANWTCEALDKVGEKYPTLNTDNMTARQKNEIDYLLEYPEKDKAIYTKENPEGVNKRQSTYDKIDVTQIKDVPEFDTSLFTPNTYFVYKKKAATPEQIKKAEQEKIANAQNAKKTELQKLLKPLGYTLDIPQPNTPEYDKKKTLLNLPRYGPKYVEWYGSNPDIYGYTGTEVWTASTTPVDRQNCRQKIKELHGFLKNPNSQQAQTILKQEQKLLQLKNDVAYCKNNKKFLSGILGVDNELQDLFSFVSLRNAFGMADFEQQTESKKHMKKIIRESLVEVQQKKQKLLKEEKIISSRLDYLIENYNPKKKNKFYNDIISEFFYLSTQGFDKKILIQEEFKFFDALKSLFGHKWDTVVESLKEYFAMWILNKFGLPKTSIWASMISVAIGNLPFTDLKSILNCEGLTRFLTKTFTEGMVKHLQTKAELNNPFFDLLRNALMESLTQDSEFGKKVEGTLGSLICPALDSLKSKFGSMENKLKQTALSPQ